MTSLQGPEAFADCASELPVGRHPGRILIIDDDRILAESLQDILLFRGYHAEVAHSAAAVLELLPSFAVEVALIDIRLGLDDGLDLITPLRQQHPTPICVVMTAHADVDTALQALRGGAYDYLHKPVEPDYMLATLARCFEKIDLERAADETLHALRQAKILAEEANVAKSHFLANMSHELRTPLNAIIGFSEIIKTETLGPIGSTKYREYADDINMSGRHLLCLINDILDLSKVESGSAELYEENTDIPKTVGSIMTLLTGAAQMGHVHLESEVPDGVPALRADARKLKQTLVNLLSNAIKFTPAGGKVTLKISSSAENGHVFQVIDTGIGIALEDIPKALAPFQQIDSDLNRKHEGTGLGLPLAKALVELHGGYLDLRSEVGVGTTVTVRFPAERIVSSPHDTEAVDTTGRKAG